MAKTALITGASGGIGEELARVFAREKFNLVLVARSADKLLKLANELQSKHSVTVKVIAKDLTQPTAPDEVYAELAGTQIDVLVNNAGYATYGNFWDIDTRKDIDEIQLNVTTLTHLTKLFLPGMVQRRDGKILNVASTAAFQPGPLMAVYYATKAFVLSLSEALSEELKGTGVTVTALCPGPTQSGFQERAAMTESRLVQGGLMTSKQVAEAGYKALMRGQVIHITGLRNRLLALTVRFTPRPNVRRLVMNMQKRVGH
ncbi:MAG: SDR family oxidoreductase [bacterium]|nr:SDR family oxidoreductase [bacterium]